MSSDNRIALNLNYMLPGVVGGTETYASGVTWALAERYPNYVFDVYLNQESAEWPLPATRNLKRVVCPVNASNRLARYWFEQVTLPHLLDKSGAALVHSLGYVSPLFTSCPRVVSIHDMNYASTGMALTKRLPLSFFVRQSAMRAQKIIVPSNSSKNQLMKAFGLPESRMKVIYMAPKRQLVDASNKHDPSSLFARFGIRRPYAMAFATSSPHKNINKLLASFDRAVKRYGLDLQLVLVGRFAWDLVDSAMITPVNQVTLTGYLDDFSVTQLLRRAEFFIVPSLYEGFGLPVLEAMEVGVPVASSNAASLPEVAGDAALLFDPHSVEEMAEAIARLAQDGGLRAELRDNGFSNVARFSWENAAAETIAVYEEVLAGDRK